MQALQTCRLCKKSNFESSERMFRLGVRHNVHASCALAKWGAGFFERISRDEIASIPYFTLRDSGLLEAARAKLKTGEKK